jgi:ParB family chromosome partitioning protein
MTLKRRGLGRGLDALLGSTQAYKETDQDPPLNQIPLDKIQCSPFQPRKDIREETLEDLANSIRAQGVVQPIVVRPLEEDVYELVAGERRWRAARMAGLHEIPAVTRNVSDKVVIAIALIENIQREDLNSVEEAMALQRLIVEFGMTHQQVADAIGRSRTAVTNLLRLLTLHEYTRQLLEHGDLEMGHARALLALEGELQHEAARTVVAKGLSVRETEDLVRRLQKGTATKVTQKTPLDPNIRRLQDDLSARLGASVRLQHSTKGKGKITASIL